MQSINLRIPGPTPLPPEVIEALSKPMISHRGEEYKTIHREVIEMARSFFQTKNDLFLFTSSGTGMMEAAIVNTLSPGDRVLAVTIGMFGNRFAEAAKALGMQVTVLSYEMGTVASPQEVAKAFSEIPDCKAVIITHNETSTAMTNDIAAIVQSVRRAGDPLFLVDSVSGMGSMELPVDEIGLDVVFSACQKGWMSPPGISLVSVGEKAWEAYAKSQSRRYYFDFRKMKKYNDKYQTPETPAVATIRALHAALGLMTKRGVKQTFAYYRELAEYTRRSLIEAGFMMFGDQSHASNSVSACLIPKGLEDSAFRSHLKKTYGVIIGGGKGEMEGKIVRVAHMGWVTKSDIDEVVTAMVKTREDLA